MTNPSSSVARPRPRYRQARQIVLLAVGLLVGWRGVLALWPKRANFAESNFYQNILRIENYQGQVRAAGGRRLSAVLVGTSVAGRVLTEYFASTPLAGIANLGLDGIAPGFGLELLLREVQVPQTVLLETYLLHKGRSANEKTLQSSLASPGASLAAVDLLFRTEARPSSLLYSVLKRSRELGTAGAAAAASGPYWTNAAPDEVMERLSSAISALQNRGAKVILVDIPVGIDWPPGPHLGEPTSSALIAKLKLSRWDIRATLLARGDGPSFTDPVHLDGVSAQRVAQLLGEKYAESR